MPVTPAGALHPKLEGDALIVIGGFNQERHADPQTLAKLRAVARMSPADAKKLDLNLFFVGVEGIDAESAPDDERFAGVDPDPVVDLVRRKALRPLCSKLAAQDLAH